MNIIGLSSTTVI